MSESVRIRLSVGLIAVAVLHALLLAVAFTLLHRDYVKSCVDCDYQVPVRQEASAVTAEIEKLAQPQSVNLQAQGELKQQGPVCPPGYQPSGTVVRKPVYQPPAPQRPTVAPSSSAAKPATTPNTVQPPRIVAPASPPPKKSYEIALFVGPDATSNRLQQWFSQHPGLTKLKAACEFQVYTAENAIYRARFQDVVPVSQFPVVLFQDASGGHIHAAGRSMIPSTDEQLYSDLHKGYELYQQAKQAQKTGAVKARGYSWDDAISPTLYLSPEDCPDGYCPPEPTDRWRPGDRVRDLLFDDVPATRNALMWVSAGELATLALIVLAVILLGFILIKRGM
jgi:hypothetical protein